MDFTTFDDVTRLRLRVGDLGDIPLLPDSVYTQTLADCNNSLTRSTKLIAQYICAMLAQNCHQKLVQIEIWGSESFNNYLKYIQAIVLNPQLSDQVPMPYAAGTNHENPLIQFIHDWNHSYVTGTQSQLLHMQAETNYYGYEAWNGTL